MDRDGPGQSRRQRRGSVAGSSLDRDECILTILTEVFGTNIGIFCGSMMVITHCRAGSR